MHRIVLYESKTKDIEITMLLSFNAKDQLIFDGYDSGKKVNELLGDSDYEYHYTIEPAEAAKLYPLFGVRLHDRQGLLQALKAKFGVNEAYSLLGKFLKDHDIAFSAFTWI